jgi:hypothetical protein
MAQIGWTHHRILLDSVADQPAIYVWYGGKAADNRRSVRQLNGQIDLQLDERHGAALTNFTRVLEPTGAGTALRATKDVRDFPEMDASRRRGAVVFENAPSRTRASGSRARLGAVDDRRCPVGWRGTDGVASRNHPPAIEGMPAMARP